LDILSIQDSSIILDGVRFAFADVIVDASSLAVIGIDISNRDNISETRMVMGIPHSHSPHADATDRETIVCR